MWCGKVNLSQVLWVRRLYLIIHYFNGNTQTNGAKVFSQKGNSPNWLLRYVITINLKELALIFLIIGRLGSSHPLKKV